MINKNESHFSQPLFNMADYRRIESTIQSQTMNSVGQLTNQEIAMLCKSQDKPERRNFSQIIKRFQVNSLSSMKKKDQSNDSRIHFGSLNQQNSSSISGSPDEF